MNKKVFPCIGEHGLRTLEEKINSWISAQRCWLVIKNLFWKVVMGNPALVVEYSTERRGPHYPPRTRAKVLYGPPASIEEYMALIDESSVGHLHSTLLECGDSSGATCRVDFNVMVLFYRSRVVRVPLGYDCGHATRKLNEWLRRIPATQCPDSIVAVENESEITVDIGTSPFVPKKRFAFCGAVFGGSEDELTHWQEPAPQVPDELSHRFAKFPARLISNVAANPIVGSYRVLISRFELPNLPLEDSF